MGDGGAMMRDEPHGPPVRYDVEDATLLTGSINVHLSHFNRRYLPEIAFAS